MMECRRCGSLIQAATSVCPVCRSLLHNPDAGSIASPIRRLGGFLMDSFIWGAIGVAGTVFVGAAERTGAAEGVATLVMFASLALLVYAWSHGTSPGKWVLGMYVYRTSGRKAGFFIMVLRETIGKFLSGLILSLGFLWILLDRNNQGWHDKLVSTVVLKRRS